MPRRKLEKPNYRLRLRGRTWAIDFTDPVTGRTRRVSTGESERSRAEVWRDQWIAGREQPLPPPQPTVAAILDAYVTARLPHVNSKAVLRVSATTIRRLIGNLEPRMLARGTYTIARRNESGALSRPISDGSVRREVAVLRAALSWSVREKWIPDAPYVEMPPRPPPRDRWLTRDDVDRLIHAARSPHIRLFVVLAFHTAARAGAILDLTWDRVDFERRLIHYDRPGRRQTKKRRAVVSINTPALAALQEARMVAVTDYVIEWRGRKVNSIKRGFAAACRRAGVEKCSPHVLRHSSASHMVMEGVPLAMIARTLGDSEAMIEKVYGHHSPNYLRPATDALAGPIVSATNLRQGRATQGVPRTRTPIKRGPK
jgi:integrase